MGLKEDVKLEPDHIAEIRSKVENMKQVLNVIEEEIKQKGELDGEYYSIKGSVLFNAKKWSEKINSVVRNEAFKILDNLNKIFPFIPYEDFKERIGQSELAIPMSRSHAVFYSISSSKFKNTAFASLMDLCEILDDPETVYELQKPLYVALAYIFHSRRRCFTKKDFEEEFKTSVLDSAIDLALKKGWIIETDSKHTYEIKNRADSIAIICPFCGSKINAYGEYCPKCGLYLLNMILKRQKATVEDVPTKLLEKNRETNEWTAYFQIRETPEARGDRGLFMLCYGIEEYDYFDKVLSSVMEQAEKMELCFKIPDYIKYSAKYTKLFGSLYFVNVFDHYFKVKGKSAEEIQQKLIQIKELLIRKASSEHSYLKPLIQTEKKEFIKRFLGCCASLFDPWLEKHPIFSMKDKPLSYTLRCKNCGSEMPYDAKYCGVCGTKLFERTNASFGQG
jgi:hypothetical protein